jgi:hypothetical protein
VSRFDEGLATILFFSKIAPSPRTRLFAPALTFRPWRSLPPYGSRRAMTRGHRCACLRRPLILFGTTPALTEDSAFASSPMLNRPASLDAHDRPALPCSRSRTCSKRVLFAPFFGSAPSSTHLFSHIFAVAAPFGFPAPFPIAASFVATTPRRLAALLRPPTISRCRAPRDFQTPFGVRPTRGTA